MTQFASTLYPQTNPTNAVLLRFREDFANHSRTGSLSLYAAEYVRFWSELSLRNAEPKHVNHARKVINRLASIAPRCLCGGGDGACKHRPFKPCCGACMDDSPHRQDVIVWPLSG